MNFDEMDLPLANPNEDLETISRNFIRPLFDVVLFEVREEHYRDKGIDFSIEVKKGGKYTNFRCNVQLKATESIKANADGSYSMQLDTSNIQYLLNSGQKAYYVLYHKENHQVLYEDLAVIHQLLEEKDTKWNDQGTHTIRFSKALTTGAAKLIYNETLAAGILNRQIKDKLVLSNSVSGSKNYLSIDVNLNQVYDDDDIRQIIEHDGMFLINSGRWNEILELHAQGSQRVAASALYNLIVGSAYFSSNQRYEALVYLRKSMQAKEELPAELQGFTIYYTLSLQYLMGLVSEQQYNSKIDEIDSGTSAGILVKFDKEKGHFLNAPDEEREERKVRFITFLIEVIGNSLTIGNLRALAICELYHLKMEDIHLNYLRYVQKINLEESEAGEELPELRVALTHDLIENYEYWKEQIESVIRQAHAEGNFYIYNLAQLYQIKALYQRESVFSITAVGKREVALSEVADTSREVLNAALSDLQDIIDYCSDVNSTSLLVEALYNKYQILHLIGEQEAADITLEELRQLIVNHELTELDEGIKAIASEGPMHLKYVNIIREIVTQNEAGIQEFKIIANDCNRMDADNLNSILPTINGFRVRLIPFGVFLVLPHQKDQFIELLHLTHSPLVAQLSSLFLDGDTPVLNLYFWPIINIGEQSDHEVNADIDVWRRLHAIRKKLFDANIVLVAKEKA